MEYLNVNIPINTTSYPSGLYDWMRILAGGVSKFKEIRMQPEGSVGGGGKIYDRFGVEILGGGGGGGAPVDATYILKTPNATLTNAQALNALGNPSSNVLGVDANGTVLVRTNINENAGLGKLSIGTDARFASSGTNNINIGKNSGNATQSQNSVIIGYGSLQNTTNSDGNVAVGMFTGQSLTNGAANVLVGYQANLTGGSIQSVVIGSNASSTSSNTIALGSGSTVSQSNSANISVPNGVKVGINNPTPICTLDMKTSDAVNCPVAVKFQAIPKTTIPFAGLAANEGFLLTSNTDDANEAILYYGNKTGIQRIPFNLSQLIDVSSGVQGATNGQVLTYNSTISRWENQTIPSISIVDSSVRAQQTGTQTIPATTATTVLFPTELYDNNNNFNSTTGIFTAPANGIYAVSCYLTIDNPSATDCDFGITSTIGLVAEWRGNPNAISNSTNNKTIINLSGNIRLISGNTINVSATCSTSTTISSSILNISIIRAV